MGSSIRLIAVAAGLLSLAFEPSHGQTDQALAGFYVVAEYDDSRDPAADLAVTVERARAEGKRILLEVGGTWCGWCTLLDGFIRDHPAVSGKLEAGFLIMKVNWSRENQNQAFLDRYPPIPGFPHIFVLERDGSFLHSQDTVDLEEGKSYNEGALLAFLNEWMPS
jgi:thiol:disulfide interchange protein